MDNIYLPGVIDLHIHSSPDIRERSHNDIELAQEAKRIGVRSIVIKSHFVPTMDRAWFLRQLVPEVLAYGSITLNPSVGGINPHAVEAALKLGAKTVWLPTLFSKNHRKSEGKSDGIETINDNKVIPNLKEVLKLISQYNAILGTGHLSPKEIFVIVEEARKQGVKKISVTHPEFHIVGLTLKEQQSLVNQYGVFFERTYAQPIGNGQYKSNLEDNLKAIETIGYESTIISTDSGQIENPPWSSALHDYIHFLHSHGIAKDALDTMTKHTPAKMLDLDRL